MIPLDNELARLLFHPHQLISYDQNPKVISMEVFDLAKDYYETKLSESVGLRSRLGLSLNLKDVLNEYKQWVDLIDNNKIISKVQENSYAFELKKTRVITTYLFNLYKSMMYSETLSSLTRLQMEMANPFVYYHIANYAKLHNNYRESVKNYYIPDFYVNI